MRQSHCGRGSGFVGFAACLVQRLFFPEYALCGIEDFCIFKMNDAAFRAWLYVYVDNSPIFEFFGTEVIADGLFFNA